LCIRCVGDEAADERRGAHERLKARRTDDEGTSEDIS
jgi:hypothetical protein